MKETSEERKARRQKQYDEKRMTPELKKHLKDPKVWMDYEPVPVEDMFIKSYRYTLCEILRECYHRTTDPVIKRRLRVACAVGKALCARITFFEGYRRWGMFQYMWNPHRKHERAKRKFETWYNQWLENNSEPSPEDEKENT